MTSGPVYCTILAGNYLPKALTLADSLAIHHPDSRLQVLLIDVADDAGLPDLPTVDCLSTASLGLKPREVLHLATIYDLVEFATAVKPLLLQKLLADHEQVVYLDPDTYVTAPMAELSSSIAATEGGILLTPHFLEPLGPDAGFTDGHLLTVGVYNLGFCAIDRRASQFLEWWWAHLKVECVCDPLSGLFVDQKWMDIATPLFRAGTFRHYGYNVGVANVHERPLDEDDDGYVIATNGDRLRLFHFHAFDTSAPEELSTRFDGSTAHLRQSSKAVAKLTSEYAERLIKHEQTLGEAAPYPYFNDAAGRPISRHLRRAYREAGLESFGELPSAFLASDEKEWAAWRRNARRAEARGVAVDMAKSLRLIFPEEYRRAKRRFPGIASRYRSKYLKSSGIWS